MNNDSPSKAILVVVGTALVCSVLVTVTAVTLQPIQRAYEDLARIRIIVEASGVTSNIDQMSDLEIINAFQGLESRIVDLSQGEFDDSYDANSLDLQTLADDPEFQVPIPPAEDSARLGERPRLVPVYLATDDDELQRLVLPVYGEGMWSTIYGYLVLENDLNTIDSMTIYEHGETPGIGDAIEDPDWLEQWQGRQLYDDQGTLQFSINSGAVDPESDTAIHQVDGLVGATITANGVMNLVRYWLGPHGFAPFLHKLSAEGAL
ncbi:MAG: Na(+)-translocating NADH-quinone reductase subunit C [Gammaproteobacteria bacterium]